MGTLTGKPERSYSQSDLFVLDLAGTRPGAARNLTEGYDYDIGGGIGGDQASLRHVAVRHARPSGRATGRRSPWWPAEQGDGKPAARRQRGASGKPSPVLKGSHAVQSRTRASARTARRSSRLVSTQMNIGDLFMVGRAQQPRQITRINEDLFRTLKLSEPEEVWWTSLRRQEKIQGWVLHPPDFEQDEKIPLHPGDSRRPALGIRQRVHPRVPLPGRRAVTSCCSRTRAAAATTGRTSATSSSSTIRATITRI